MSPATCFDLEIGTDTVDQDVYDSSIIHCIYIAMVMHRISNLELQIGPNKTWIGKIQES